MEISHSKEYSVREILTLAWRIYKENFKAILYITLIVYIPLNFILSLLPTTDQISPGDPKSFLRLLEVLEGLLGIIATLAIAYLVKARSENESLNFKQALNKALERFLPALGTNILMGILLLLLFLLLIVPGVIFSVYWAFSTYVVAFKNLAFMKALNYSKSLVFGRWWRTLNISAILTILAIVISLVLSLPAQSLPNNFITTTFWKTVIDIISAYFTVAYVIFYLNWDKTKKIS